MANPLLFPLPNRVQYLPVFIYSLENFLISNFIKPADLFYYYLYPHLSTVGQIRYLKKLLMDF